MNKDEVLKLANECGAYEEINTPLSECIIFEKDWLLAFANACEKIGMEKSAKICEMTYKDFDGTVHLCFDTPQECAEAIRDEAAK